MSQFLISLAWRVWHGLCRYFQLLWRMFVLRGQTVYAGRKTNFPAGNSGFRCPPKPPWVAREIIRLKALMIHDGCRKIADTFNRLYEYKKHMTVGKTYVYETVKKHRYEIQVLRRRIKHRKPRSLPKNLIWSLDLTQVTDNKKQLHTVFGMIDSGTRACIALRDIPGKASVVLLRCLLDAIECYGKPKIVRTDNEAVFISRLFRFGLWLLNIRHQRTDVCCPWQNGKIERLFGTLKEKLTHYAIASTDTLAKDLRVFRVWYNHIRTHQHLGGRTPAEVWNQ
jgi:transposase InsO family protein